MVNGQERGYKLDMPSLPEEMYIPEKARRFSCEPMVQALHVVCVPPPPVKPFHSSKADWSLLVVGQQQTDPTSMDALQASDKP